MATKKKSTKPETESTVTSNGEETAEERKPAPRRDDHPLASGTVSVGQLRIGARDNDSVRRLQYALAKQYPGAVQPTGNYQTRTANLAARALDTEPDTRLSKAQAEKILGSAYTVTD